MRKKLLVLLSLAIIAFLLFIIVKIPDSEWALVSLCIILMISAVFFVFENMETFTVIVICLGMVLLYNLVSDIIHTPSNEKAEISTEQYHWDYKIHTYDELDDSPTTNSNTLDADPAVNGNANRGGGPNRK